MIDSLAEICEDQVREKRLKQIEDLKEQMALLDIPPHEGVLISENVQEKLYHSFAHIEGELSDKMVKNHWEVAKEHQIYSRMDHLRMQHLRQSELTTNPFFLQNAGGIVEMIS